MFKGMANIAEIIKQVGRMRGEMERVGEELKKLVVEGSAGGGMVKIRMNGKHELLECKIDSQVFADQDAELLEDLVVAATNQALEKARLAESEQFGKVAGGLNIPGLSDAMSQLSGPDPNP